MSLDARDEIRTAGAVRSSPAVAGGVLLGLLVGLAASPVRAAVVWRTDFEVALAEARVAGRPVLLDFWAVWCGPCQAMDAAVWSRDDVTERTATFAMVRVDVDKAGAVASNYGVSAYPTVVVTDSWGNGIARQVGAASADEILALLDVIPRDFRPIDRWNETLAENAKHGEALVEIGRFYAERELPALAVDYFEAALKSERAKREPPFAARTLVAFGWNQLKLREFKRAEKAFERALGGAPATADREAALFGLVVAAVGRDDRRRAERRLADLRAGFPASEASEKAARLVTERR